MSLFPSITDALDRSTGTPVSLVARVSAVGNPEPCEGRAGYRITLFCPHEEQELTTAPLTSRAHVEIARAALKQGHRVLCHGFFDLAERASRSARPAFTFVLTGIERLRATTPLLCPTGDEQAEADALLDRLAAAPAGAATYLNEALHRLLGVRDRSLSERFRLAERAVVYAAVACGQVEGRTNPRPSLLLVSKPGMGKKILCDEALALNPVGYVVQSGMATPAGLSASVAHSAARGFHASAGLLALFDQGVAVLEDLHRLEPDRLQAIRDCLASVMEDGQLVASKAARGDFQAHTALQMSVNRQTDLRGRRAGALKGAGARLKDVGMTLDLASRVDYWCDLDVGDNACASAREMLAPPAGPPLTDEERRRSGGR